MMSTMTAQETTLPEELLDDELGLELAMEMGMDTPTALRPSAFPTRVLASAETRMPIALEQDRAPRSRVLSRLLAMGDKYFQAGSIRQALDMYFDLARNHPDTPEASQAEDRIFDVARVHEENGELHLARAIYEQMI